MVPLWIRRRSVRIGSHSPANDRDQRLATKGLSTPPDFIASPLHRLVRPSWGRFSSCRISGSPQQSGDFPIRDENDHGVDLPP